MVRVYIGAVFRHWKSAMTGLLALGASVIGALKNDGALYVLITAAIGLGAMFFAGYQVWKEERLLRPDISGEFFNFSLTSLSQPTGKTVCTFMVTVVSARSAISIKEIKASMMTVSDSVDGSVNFFSSDRANDLIIELRPGVHRMLTCSGQFPCDFGFSTGLRVSVIDAFGLEHPLRPMGQFHFPFAEEVPS